jgi:hypothetical protein
MTTTTLSSPVSVVAGQQVLVAVTIGFATAAAPAAPSQTAPSR